MDLFGGRGGRGRGGREGGTGGWEGGREGGSREGREGRGREGGREGREGREGGREGFYEKSRGGDFLFTKNTADDIGSFTAVCVVGVLGAINCEYRQTFMFAMCGIVTFLM